MTNEHPYIVPPSRWNGSWQIDPDSVAALSGAESGQTVRIIKYAPDGSESTHYPATVATVATSAAATPWIEVEADWTMPTADIVGLLFVTGDRLREFFSAEHPFNAFAVVSPEGQLRGWYGTVTYPAFILPNEDTLTIVWHDLYLDVVILADGTVNLLDDDELAESGMAHAHPDLATAVEQARRELIDWILAFDL